MNTIPPAATVINSSELPKGYELSNYVIERKLGNGGFGITYLAREIATNRAVVIKENFPQECSQRHTTNLTVGPSSRENKEIYEWALTRFLDEAKVLVRLSHPGIVPVLTAFKALGTAYYVMPQVEGTVIHKAAPSPRAINEAWLRPVLQKLLEALDYLHGQGLLHRDIKPSNILMCADGSPLLIDFGTARSSDASHTLTRIGSPGFSPSEQFTTHGKNGAWTDLYSLGATCYYLITGEVPQDAVGRLEGDTLLPLANRKELRGRFSSFFLGAIDKAMRVSRIDRWQSTQEWLDSLNPPKPPELPLVSSENAHVNKIRTSPSEVHNAGIVEIIKRFVGIIAYFLMRAVQGVLMIISVLVFVLIIGAIGNVIGGERGGRICMIVGFLIGSSIGVSIIMKIEKQVDKKLN